MNNKIGLVIESLREINEVRGNEETRTYKITGDPNMLDDIEKLFSLLKHLGEVGASREVRFFFDGDGKAYIKVERTDKKVDIVSDKYDLDKDTISLGSLGD